MSTTTTRSRPHSRRLGASIATAATAAVVLVPASPAAAHHGWDGFETGRLVYLAGEVSSNGRWGEPHSYFDVTLDSDLPTDTPDLTIPEDLQHPEDSIRVASAPSYSGPRQTLEVIIAPPAWSGRWGLGRPLAIDERFQAVGYVNRSNDRLFRPVAFWYGDDQVPVNQVLGNTLPVRAPLPGTTVSSPVVAAPAPSIALDPLEVPAPAADTEAASGEGDSSTAGVWTLLGVAVLAAIAGSYLYLRRNTRQG